MDKLPSQMGSVTVLTDFLNSQNIYLCCRKPNINGPFLLTVGILEHWNCLQASVAPDGLDGNGKLRLNFSSCFRAPSKN